MAVIEVNEKTGAIGAENEKGDRTYTRVFHVVTNSSLDGGLTVRLALGIPRRGDFYATQTDLDEGAFCKTITAQQDSENPRVWEVRVEYGPSEDAQQDENPLNRAADVSCTFAKFQRVVWQDNDGKGIFNSTGMYFDPPVEIDDSRPVITIERNEAAFDLSLASDFQDAVNGDSWYGFSPGMVKVAGIEAKRVFDKNLIYWQVTYQFEIRQEGWTLRVLDQGRQRKAKDGDPDPDWIYPIADGNGVPVADPVPLDGNGQKLDSPSPSNAVFLPFDVYKQRDFSALNL